VICQHCLLDGSTTTQKQQEVGSQSNKIGLLVPVATKSAAKQLGTMTWSQLAERGFR